MDATYPMASVVELITPARFLFNAGKTPKAWNEKMLSDEHLKVLYYEQNSAKVFSNTDIKGGVAITYRNVRNNCGAIEHFIPNDLVRSVLSKVKAHRAFLPLSENVNSTESFNRFLIISLDVLICRYSPLFRAFPALFISEEPHKSFYYPSCFHSQK